MPTTLYGTYQEFFGTTLDDYLDNVLVDLRDDVTGVPRSITNQSREALKTAWLDRVQSHLPEGVTVHGDEFYGSCDAGGNLTVAMVSFLATVREGIEIWDLVELHAVPILLAFYTTSGVILVDGCPVGEFTGRVADWPTAVESIIRDAEFSPVPGLDHLTWSRIQRGPFAGDYATYVVVATA